VIAGLLAVLDHPEAHGEYNIGTGRASSVLDIIEALEPYADGDFAPIFAEARAGEIERSCLDVTRAGTELGWSAQVDLADGLHHTANWTQVDRVPVAG
jgi:UDP-glucose 4-epimerase